MKPSIKLKIKRAFTNNIGLKILAAVFAVGLWLIVVNVDNPNQTRTFSAPVTVINEEVLTEAGRYYTIPDGNNMVKFRVTARRSVIEQLSGADFTATADMNFLENDSRIPVMVTFNGQSTGVTISAKRLYLQVVVGDDMMMKHEVVVETKGDLAEGCVVQSATAEPNNVTLTGPQEVLSQVTRVVAYADVTDAGDDFELEDVVLHFLDEKGNEVDRSRIKVDQDVAKVSVKIARQKQVDVNVSTSGSLAEGLYLDSVTVNPSKVTIMGDAKTLNDITAITIPGSVVDLSQIQSSTTTTVDLNTYLPEGVKVASGESSQAEIVIKVSGDTTHNFELSTANITVRNLSDGLAADFDDAKVTVQIKGSKEDLNALDAKTITGYVDASGLGAGKHTLQLNLELADAYTASPATVKITIK